MISSRTISLKRLAVSFLLLASAHLLPREARAQSQDILYFLIDSSGSMWGQIDGKPKFTIANEAIEEATADIPASVRVGMTAYGHRRKEDCTDIEEILAPAPNDPALIKGTLSNLRPLGKSPISDSIETIVRALAKEPGKKTIILLTDGIETCGKDPCETVKKLRGEGLDFQLNIIGLKLAEGEQEQFECMATAGGGKHYFPNQNEQLRTALALVKEEAVKSGRVVMPVATSGATAIKKRVPTPFVKEENRPGRIVIEHEDWLIPPFYWRLINADSGEEAGKFNSFDERNAPAGHYVLAWRQYEHGSTEVILGNVVDVLPGETTTVAFRTGINLVVPPWVQHPFYWALQDPITKEQLVSFNTFEPLLVPAGDYELVWKQFEAGSQPVVLRRLQIEPGRVNDINLSTAINPIPADWMPTTFDYWGLKRQSDGAWVAKYSGGFSEQLVPTGKYQLVYHASADDQGESILGDVTVEENQAADFNVNTGVLLKAPENWKAPQRVQIKEIKKNAPAASGDAPLEATDFEDKKPLDAGTPTAGSTPVAQAGNESSTADFVQKALNSAAAINVPEEIATFDIKGSFGPFPLRPGTYQISYVPYDAPTPELIELSTDLTIEAGQLAEIDLTNLLHPVSIRQPKVEEKTEPLSD